MSIFVIGDLHLSLGTSKPMDIFPGWNDYHSRLQRNWQNVVKPTDTVIICGDISWAIDLKEAVNDFNFIEGLNGSKIILKGNHDYWWETYKKLENFLEENGYKTIRFLYNNSFEVENIVVCGTRGWMFENGQPENEKIILRESGRLKASLGYMKTDKEKVAFLHYPTIFQDMQSTHIINTLQEYNVKRCFYGHLHGKIYRCGIPRRVGRNKI
ncbi:MAG: metallophosphoesterase [Oscillospiraceae bacterium]